MWLRFMWIGKQVDKFGYEVRHVEWIGYVGVIKGRGSLSS